MNIAYAQYSLLDPPYACSSNEDFTIIVLLFTVLFFGFSNPTPAV